MYGSFPELAGRPSGRHMNHVLRALLGCAVAAILSLSQKAEACGCFAPPSTVEPIVQAGERILFSVKDGKVTPGPKFYWDFTEADA